MPRKFKPFAVRFWEKVRKTDGCWEWTGAKNVAQGNRLPYGIVWKNEGKTWLKAHRVAWTLTYGEIADSLFICHSCDNPICVRPEHLFIGTKLDNNRDRNAKGRHRHGAQHWKARLTEDDVRDIRRRYADGYTQQELADEYGVGQTAIGKIVQRKLWKHVA